METTADPSAMERRDLLRPFRYVWRVPAVLLWAFGGCLLAIFIILPFGAPRPGTLGGALIRNWSRGFLACFGVRVQRVGEPLGDPAMFVANHGSWMDISVLHTQREAGFVAKAEISRWPLVSWMARRGGTIFHERGSTHSLGAVMTVMSERLRSGYSVAAFPEGGTAPAGTLKVFHARIFQAAVDANALVQPVAIRYLRDDRPWQGVSFRPGESFIGNLWRMMGQRRIVAEVHFLQPVANAEEGRRRMADMARARIAQALGIPA
ncbi:MAG TPA: lysophospholipid acyltransferase family protein [Rhodanobacteraceae bacterium]|nr:lysophospholipid acyltransferase family protein [Rhodanobacteraceae bacterium]